MSYDITQRDMHEVMAILKEYKRDRQEPGAPATAEEAWQEIARSFYECRDQIAQVSDEDDRAMLQDLAANVIGYIIDHTGDTGND